jgi:hypothetical protein
MTAKALITAMLQTGGRQAGRGLRATGRGLKNPWALSAGVAAPYTALEYRLPSHPITAAWGIEKDRDNVPRQLLAALLNTLAFRGVPRALRGGSGFFGTPLGRGLVGGSTFFSTPALQAAFQIPEAGKKLNNTLEAIEEITGTTKAQTRRTATLLNALSAAVQGDEEFDYQPDEAVNGMLPPSFKKPTPFNFARLQEDIQKSTDGISAIPDMVSQAVAQLSDALPATASAATAPLAESLPALLAEGLGPTTGKIEQRLGDLDDRMTSFGNQISKGLSYLPAAGGGALGYLLGGRLADMTSSQSAVQANRRRMLGQLVGAAGGSTLGYLASTGGLTHLLPPSPNA